MQLKLIQRSCSPTALQVFLPSEFCEVMAFLFKNIRHWFIRHLVTVRGVKDKHALILFLRYSADVCVRGACHSGIVFFFTLRPQMCALGFYRCQVSVFCFVLRSPTSLLCWMWICRMICRKGKLFCFQDENLIVNMTNGEVKLVDFGATASAEKAMKKEFQGWQIYT